MAVPQPTNQQDPYLQGYGDSYEGYGGTAPNFNRHFGEIKSPPDGKKQFNVPNMPNIPLPKMGGNFFSKYLPTGDLNFHLLISKTFYFFFFAAFGSLFPLIAVYFKQIGMNPSQSGVLIGFRPFVEFFSAPFWGTIADRYKKWKQILLFSILCWIGFTLGLAFVRPPPHSCLTYNSTHVILVPAWSKEAMNIDPSHPYDSRGSKSGKSDMELDQVGNLKFDKPADKDLAENNLENVIRHTISDILPYPKIVIYGKSPLPLDHTKITNVDQKDVEGLVSPPFSSIVYKASDIQKLFWIILLLMMIGEFFSAPAITLADSATLGYLEEDIENYGKQRMFGSLGWGLAMFFVGIALDQADIFANHPCGYKQKVERNYMVCFAVFTVLMSCAFLTATKFKFKDGDDFNKESIKMKHFKQVKDKLVGKVKEAYDATKGFGKQQMTSNGDTIYNGDGIGPDGKKIEIKLDSAGADMVTDAMDEQEASTVVTRPTPFVPRGQPGQSGTLPEWVTVIKLFGNVRIGSMLFLTWFMGFGVGLVFTFLFWHLQDLHGTPTLFGIASVINHISEILAYFFSKKLINAIGHVKVLYLGLLGNVARFLYVSYLRQPWSVLPFELLQGLTHAAVWAACCSYITQATPTHLRATAQGILQGIHHGLGRGCGSVIGGILVYYYGTENVFRGYGITCLIIFAAYFALNYFYIRKLPMPAAEEDPREFVEEGMHLAPCGVPMGMNRNLSSSKLQDMGQDKGDVHNQGSYHGDARNDANYGYGSDSIGGSVVLPAAPQAHTDTYLQQPHQRQEYGYDIR